jgi:ankyrin repeat protein
VENRFQRLPFKCNLQRYSADVNAPAPTHGCFPLHIACEHGNLAAVERLLTAGSRVSAGALSDAGSTPLHLVGRRTLNQVDT